MLERPGWERLLWQDELAFASTNTPHQAILLAAAEHRSGEPSEKLRGDSMESRDTSSLVMPNLVESMRTEDRATDAHHADANLAPAPGLSLS
jgi:hypothetical protein